MRWSLLGYESEVCNFSNTVCLCAVAAVEKNHEGESLRENLRGKKHKHQGKLIRSVGGQS